MKCIDSRPGDPGGSFFIRSRLGKKALMRYFCRFMSKSSRKKRGSHAQSSHAKWKWPLFIVLSVLLITVIYYGYRILGPNTRPFTDHRFFYIRTGSSYGQVVNALQAQGIVRDLRSFEWLSRRLDYPAHVHAGKYRITPHMSNLALIRLLRSGRQTPVRLVINKLRTKADFSAFVGMRLEPDSGTMAQLLNDPVYLRQFGLDTNTALCAILPNTYEFFWNTSAEKIFDRLNGEREKFWTPQRTQLADSLGLTPNQVYILASIVEEETNKARDKPLITSVYLNRLRVKMPLAADPTARFAVGDFTLKRITGKQTSFRSAYNTYLQPGLPPGPICTPSVKTIDAVLSAPHTDYFYFCAKADFSGYNVYAATYQQHLKNARAYQRALDSLNVH